MTETIKVGVLGAAGRMGAQICAAIDAAADLDLVARVDSGDSREALIAADVVVDVTLPGAVMSNIEWCVAHGKAMVVGTSGFTAERIAEVQSMAAGSAQAKILICPNFSIGAILMMRWAAQAARHFPAVEVVEYHHTAKVDAPSGTAVRTAQLISDARVRAGVAGAAPDSVVPSDVAQTTEVAGVRVHSVRGDGYVAHQDVLFTGPGEQLVISHDSLDRSSFMPGVLLGIRGVLSLTGVVVGLESLLDL